MWLSGSSRLSVTHLDLSHFLSALSGSLKIIASRLPGDGSCVVEQAEQICMMVSREKRHASELCQNSQASPRQVVSQSFQNKPVTHQSRASGPERGDHSIERYGSCGPYVISNV
ncbi:hypothetical protein F2P79_001686 [Pimephales promelas]|nr:hypothetical protein F2P79_001686 [Pimephales promelas]